MSSSRQVEIYIRNAQDEYITTVRLDSPSTVSRGGHAGDEDLMSLLPSKCVVVDYTRDPTVLSTRAGAAGALTMVSVQDHEKLKSFRGYLSGRQKAGIVTLPGAGGKLFLLPSVDGACMSAGENIVGVLRPAAGLRPYPPQAQAPPARVAPPRAPSDDSGGGAQIGGFLGSLMGTLNQTHKSVAGAATVDRVSKAQEQAIRNKVERFKVEVREKLAAFATDTDSSVVSHAFPHVEKSLRSIQHGLAEDFDGITSRTEGETDDRHVVVYKLGYEPPEEEVQLDPQVHVAASSRKSASPSNASLAPMPAIGGGRGSDAAGPASGGILGGGGGGAGPVSAADLVQIGTVVKDRRTVQDIEEDARQSKRRRGPGSGGGGSGTT